MKCIASLQNSFSVTNEREKEKTVEQWGKCAFQLWHCELFSFYSQNRDRFID